MHSSKPLDGQVILVTGAATGIGNATAQRLFDDGATVILCDVNEKVGQEAAARMDSSLTRAIFIKADVSSTESVDNLFSTIKNRFGKLNGAFNNAGISGEMGTPLGNYRKEEWHRVFGVNIDGVFYCLQHEINLMKESGGSIVNTASIWGTVGAAGACAYVASKHAVIGLTKAAALEYATQGIRINSVSPGSINTPILDRARDAFDGFDDYMIKLHPIGRFGEPSEIGDVVAWLLSDRSSFVTGHNVVADGGFTIQ